jgi:3-phenylpropionate/trans-cinnamate dioxygenase ferredoxin reductase subunit
VLGRDLGAVYRDIHLDHGVQMRLGAGLEAFEGADAVERVRTSAGDAIDCDFVVVGIGVQPRSAIAARAGIETGDGILVDEHLRTDARDVFAAGDVASVQHPFYRERIRVEHWDSAREQGPVAARNMLGRELPYARLPYFFSDQYEIGMEYTGYARTADRLIVRGEPGTREFIAFWLRGDQVVAGMNMNVWDVVDPIGRLIRDRVSVDERTLADPDVPLETLAPVEQGAS